VDIETLVEALVDEADVTGSIKPERQIEEHIEPDILERRSEFDIASYSL
jgi:hypothetical protein